MIRIFKLSIHLIFLIGIFACENKQQTTKEQLRNNLLSYLKNVEGDVAIGFINLSDEKDFVFINDNENFHAASTMKVPVMIELYKQAELHKINLNDSIVIKNDFKSIVDSSSYTMDIIDDSDDVLYNKIGNSIRIYDLMYSMITLSSNLATNMLIELVNPKNVTASMRKIGAEYIEVLRGVEDQKAYDLGLNNTTTAKDLLLIMKAIATNKAGTKINCEEMIHILKNQQFNEIIPFYLPKDIVVAHKTGYITGVHHDAAIVYLPNGKAYVLVLLSKNLKNFDKGTNQLAEISKIIYDYVVQ